MIETMNTNLLTEQNRQNEMQKLRSSIAMSVLLVSFSMLFATLILSFVVFRLSSDMWPPMGMERLPLLFPVLSTVLILVSSLTFEFFVGALKKADTELARILFVSTWVLGLGFMATQFLLWNQMQELGYVLETGIFASMIYSFTWIHAAHIILGLAWLLFLIPALKQQVSFSSFEARILSAGKFWHFLGIVWVLLFITLFVV